MVDRRGVRTQEGRVGRAAAVVAATDEAAGSSGLHACGHPAASHALSRTTGDPTHEPTKLNTTHHFIKPQNIFLFLNRWGAYLVDEIINTFGAGHIKLVTIGFGANDAATPYGKAM